MYLGYEGRNICKILGTKMINKILMFGMSFSTFYAGEIMNLLIFFARNSTFL